MPQVQYRTLRGFPQRASETIRRAHKGAACTTASKPDAAGTLPVEQNDVLRTCEELGIGFVPFSPLGAGFLTGKIDTKTTFDATDFRNISPRFTPEVVRGDSQVVVDLLRKIADQKGGAPAQVALAWLLAQKPRIVPIPGTTKIHRLEENLGAVNIELTVGDLQEINSAAAKIEVHGARLPEAVLKMSER